MNTPTPQDLSAIDRLIKPQEPPERIYGWMDSQLSVARFYGGCKFQGRDYYIAAGEDGAPLVRSDVVFREVKAQNERNKAERAAKKLAAQQAQEVLL